MSLLNFKRSFQVLALSAVFTLLLSSEAHADIAPYAEAFKQAFSKEGTIYRSGQCGRNVKELLLELQNQGLDSRTASAIYLLSESRQFAGGPVLPGSLIPAFNRSYATHWDFHVILKIQDPETGESFILDLDSKPLPVPMSQYFSMMFPNRNQNDRLASIKMREIPADEYLRAFEVYHATRDQRLTPDDNYVVGDFRKPELPDYPVSSVRKFLQQEELKLKNAQ